MFYFHLWFKAGASGSQWVFAALHKYFLAHRRCEAKETCSFTVSLLSNRPTISRRWFTLVVAAHGKGLRADVTQRRRAAAAATKDRRRRSSKTQTPNGVHAVLCFNPQHRAAPSAASHRRLSFFTLHRKSCRYFNCCHTVMALCSGQETVPLPHHLLPDQSVAHE